MIIQHYFSLQNISSIIWIRNYFTLNLRFWKWYEFFFPGNDILLVKSASQPSTSIRWWILITNTPEKKVQSQHSLFFLSLPSAFVKIMQQKTYIIFWCEKMILASKICWIIPILLGTWFIQKQRKEIRNDERFYSGLFFGISLCLIKIHQLKTQLFFASDYKLTKIILFSSEFCGQVWNLPFFIWTKK